MKISLKERLIYLFVKLFSKLSFRRAYALGKIFGKIAYIIPNKLKDVADINLRKCFPEHTPEQHELILKQTLIETGKTFFETPILWFSEIPNIRANIVNITGEAIAEKALKSGKGIIAIIPHFGAWEMLPLVISHKHRTTTLYKPLKLQGLEQKIVQARARFGNTLAPTTPKGVKTIYSAIKKGEIIAILADQDPGIEHGIFAPFYNIPTLTMTLLSKIAQKTKAPTFTLMAKRVEHGFEITWEQCSEDIFNPDINEATAALNKNIERCINQDITQYQWSYKRFKTRPEGEKDFYK
jgi:Kdo2-lipid IVA lauroyltransferase/acyltransferase